MNISELKIIWEKHGFRPKKSMGQNFLIDKNIRDNIITAMNVPAGSVGVEIGPGFGVMSFAMADRCEKLFVVEKDEKIASIMKPYFEKAGNIELITGDIMDFDIKSLSKRHGKIILFGNIPYYITTGIIEKIVEARKYLKSAYIVMQAEFAERITAGPGSKTYGSITCFAQFYMKCSRILSVRKTSFYPVPNVNSSLVEFGILPKPSVPVKDSELMFKIIHQAFSQRRKQVLNPLSFGDFLGFDKDSWKSFLVKAGIEPTLRAEDIPLNGYAKLADMLHYPF